MKKRADGRYGRSFVIGYDADGKQIRKSFYAKTKWEVEKKAAEWKEKYDKGLLLRTDITFGELADMWLSTKENYVSINSYQKYKGVVGLLKAEIGSIMCTKLGVNDFIRLRTKHLAKGHKSAFNNRLEISRQILKYGMNVNILATNIAEKVDFIENAVKKKTRAFTDEERYKLLNADLDIREKAIIYTLFYTGVRRSELLALSSSDIDLTNRKVKVSKTIVDTDGSIQDHTKTPAGIRVIPMAKELYEVLYDYIQEVGQTDLLFTSVNGKTIRTGIWDYQFYKILGHVFGDDFERGSITAHMFRHNFCSDLCKAGVPLRTAMYLMGHDDIKMTMGIYSHVSAEDIDLVDLESYYERRASVRASKVAKTL